MHYSPKPITDYFITAGGHVLGLAYSFRNDPELWNLQWLVNPQWDEYLRPNLSMGDYKRLADTCDARLIAEVNLALKSQRIYLRPTLRLPPLEFMKALVKLPYMELDLFDGREALLQTMWKRARESDALMPKLDIGILTDGNDRVVKVDFKLRRKVA